MIIFQLILYFIHISFPLPSFFCVSVNRAASQIQSFLHSHKHFKGMRGALCYKQLHLGDERMKFYLISGFFFQIFISII